MSEKSEVWEARANTLHEKACDITDAVESISNLYERSDIHDVVNRAAIATLASDLADAADITKEDAVTTIIGELFSYIDTKDGDLAHLANLFYDHDDTMDSDEIVLTWNEGD